MKANGKRTFVLSISLCLTSLINSGGETVLAAEDKSAASTITSHQKASAFLIPQWSDGGGWDLPASFETIQTGDINGDKQQDLLGRANTGLMVYTFDLSRGQWTVLAVGPDLSDYTGWSDPAYYSTIQTADVDGDGKDEVLALAPEGIQIYQWTGSAWNTLKSTNTIMTDKAGWNQPQYYQTIQTADVDGDGADEVLTRSAGGMIAYKWQGANWKAIDNITTVFSDKQGWGSKIYYATIQAADIDADGQHELLGRGPAGVQTWHYMTDKSHTNPAVAAGNWGAYRAYGFPDFSDGELAAYNEMTSFLKLASAVRTQYAGADTAEFENWQASLVGTCTASNGSSPPSYASCKSPSTSVSAQNWTAVTNQIIKEIYYAKSAAGFFPE